MPSGSLQSISDALRDFKGLNAEPKQDPEGHDQAPKDPKDPNEDKEHKKEPSEDPKPKKTQEADPEPKKPKPTRTDNPESDPDKVKEPKGISKEGIEGFRKLKQIARERHQETQKLRESLQTEVSSRDAEIAELKKAVAELEQNHGTQVKKLQEELGGLSKYRDLFDIKASPEFAEKFERPVTEIKEEIGDLLKSIDKTLTDDTLNRVDLSDPQTIDALRKHLEGLSPTVADEFAFKVRDLRTAVRNRDKQLRDYEKNHSQHIEEARKTQKLKEAERDGRVSKHIEAYSSKKDDEGNPEVPFLSKQPIPAGAAPEDIQAIEKHNATVDKIRGDILRLTKLEEPEQRVELAIAATMAKFFEFQLQSSQQRIKELEEKNAKLASVRETSSPGTTPKPATNPSEYDPTNPDNIPKIGDAMRRQFSGKA